MWNGKQRIHANRRWAIGGAAAIAFALFALSPIAAVADQLDDLRVSGAVGEAFDGFARARSGSAKSFVKSLNAKRRKIYVKRAKAQSASVDQVGRVYAGKIIEDAPSKTWILSANGKWAQK